ncbi:hypothetical protein FQT01_01040 [Enterococcus faecalis]|nr:hypothetical protein [Enterococcus faecalis]
MLSFQLKSKHEKLAGNKKKNRLHRATNPRGRLRQFTKLGGLNCHRSFCCNLRYNKLYYINLCAKRKTFFLDFL